MGKLTDIREKLQAGSTAKQLVEQGYSKSSVFAVAKKLKSVQPDTRTLPAPDDLQELRHQRDIIKLQKEIADLEAARDKLPDRVAVLEKDIVELGSLLNNAVNTALYVSLAFAGMDREEAKEFAQGWVGKNIKV